MSRKRRLILPIKFLVSAGLMWFLYRNMSLWNIESLLVHIDLRPLPVILFLLFLNTLLSAWKWQILLKSDSISVPLRTLFVSYMVGSFFNIFLPSSIGGDAYRVYDIAKYSSRPVSSFASVLADRLSGFLALAILSLAASFSVFHMTNKVAIILLPAAILLALLSAIWTLCHRTTALRLLKVMRLDRFAALRSLADKCNDCFAEYRNKPGVFMKIMGISFAFQFSMIVCVFLMATSLHVHTLLVYFCAFVPIISVIEAVPISVYGIGTRDAAYVFFFGLVGLSSIETRSLALLYLAASVCYSLIGGVLFLCKKSRDGMTTKPSPATGSERRALRRPALIALAITLVVWAVFSWPLPKYVTSGIPSSAKNTEKHHRRAMIAGDHLQLMYHFWLAGDMLSRETPFFHNLYEFNTGNDDERYQPDPYYIPFSLVYAVGAWIGSRAFGWNLAGFASLYVTYLFTFLLVRRYTKKDWYALLASLVAISLPYRWIPLLGGSPTGFAMALVPMMLYGLDVAVRDERVWGGLIAGAAVLLLFCSDLHTFVFAGTLIPFWCITAFVRRPQFQWKQPAAYLRLAAALLPVVVLSLAALALSRMMAEKISTAHMADGWPIEEIARYSPWRRGLFVWKNMGVTNHVYFGYTALLLLMLGAVCAMLPLARKKTGNIRHILVYVLLGIGIVKIVCLALGTDGPFDGAPIKMLRTMLPPFKMLRQPAKVFCLMPSMLAVAAGMAMSSIASGINRPGQRLFCVLLPGLLLLAEYQHQIRPTICLLDDQQAAYGAAAHDSRPEHDPRAVVLPIWPGDSHWASLYQHYASIHRIRMVNGYSPIVQNEYFDNVFKRLESMNTGIITDEQLDWLTEREIEYVFLHEDAYPEKVGPFPVSFALKHMLHHTRLKLLKQDQRVWAFKILEQPEQRPELPAHWQYLFPAGRWEMERVPTLKTRTMEDDSAGSRLFVKADEPGACLTIRPRADICIAPHLRWMLRTRGDGAFKHRIMVNGEVATQDLVRIDSPDWTWTEIPLESDKNFFSAELDLTLDSGFVDFDMCLLAAGPWESPSVGENLEIPAPCFFHAGYTDLLTDRVVLLPEREPDRVIFYGPLMPLEPGIYEAELVFLCNAEETGMRLGEFNATDGNSTPGTTIVTPGERATVNFQQNFNLPLRLEFRYARKADMEIEKVVLKRIE